MYFYRCRIHTRYRNFLKTLSSCALERGMRGVHCRCGCPRNLQPQINLLALCTVFIQYGRYSTTAVVVRVCRSLGLDGCEVHRTGPRKKRTLYIADAKQATGQLITEIQIGQRMLGIIESSARYAQAMDRVLGGRAEHPQRQQSS